MVATCGQTIANGLLFRVDKIPREIKHIELKSLIRLRTQVTANSTHSFDKMEANSLPNNGTASDVAGIVSATIFKNTVNDSKIVTPVKCEFCLYGERYFF